MYLIVALKKKRIQDWHMEAARGQSASAISSGNSLLGKGKAKNRAKKEL